MLTEVVLPKLGFTMEKGQIAKWLKKEGDFVKKGDILFEVETDKVNLAVESREEGFLRKIMIQEGIEVEIGTVIAIIADKDENIPDQFLSDIKGLSFFEQQREADEGTLKIATGEKGWEAGGKSGIIKASPSVRRLAKEKGIDLSQLVGKGPEGRITEKDIKEYLNDKISKLSKQKEVPDKIPIDGIRKIIAERMSESSKITAPVTLMSELDFTKVIDLRKEILPNIEKEIGIKLSYLDFFIWATSRAIKQFPTVNAIFSYDEIILKKDINIGIAVDIPEGLIVPVIKEADQKNLIRIAEERLNLMKKAQNNKLAPDEIKEGTFTISNLGMLNIDYFTPIINLPEVAILGIGNIKEKPIVENQKVMIKPIVCLSLTFDHRVIDGAPAARFLNTIMDLLSNAEKDSYLK